MRKHNKKNLYDQTNNTHILKEIARKYKKKYLRKCEEPPQGIPDDHTINRNVKTSSIESNNISINQLIKFIKLTTAQSKLTFSRLVQ